MKSNVIGFPRIGNSRELKFAVESYFKGEITETELQKKAAALRKTHWSVQSKSSVDLIPSNDFSFYDNMLDTAVLLNVVPARYKNLTATPLEKYFAMARGYQKDTDDVKALAMKKWFNTNYHYMVPEIEDDTEIRLTGTKLFDEYLEARTLGFETKPVIIGPYTFIRLAVRTGSKTVEDCIPELRKAYADLLVHLNLLGTAWVQFDEPALVMDMDNEDIDLFCHLYDSILTEKGHVKVLLQTYFGDIRDCYTYVTDMAFDGIGLDFCEGVRSLALVQENGFPKNKTLFAGVVNGKNIWKNNYAKTLETLTALKACTEDIVISTSCSLLHVPYSVKNETKLSKTYLAHFAFAVEKLQELSDLKRIVSAVAPKRTVAYTNNVALFAAPRTQADVKVRTRLEKLTDKDFVRVPSLEERAVLQSKKFRLPLLPTTTIGSFPQTEDVRINRARYKKGSITLKQYTDFNHKKIAECIRLQEKLGLDVLVHGEFERNDMVEYFGENLNGYIFTEKAWVQSYGTRCVKPPVIWGDISRSKPMTVDYAVYAQKCTKKPVKGMLTGPVTILNWSFPREDISLKDMAYQIALAIREEVLDLEKNNIRMIQIDEAALREKLPLRKSDWHTGYLDWAIPAFRLVHSGVKPETQIHTHMCYSEFDDIIKEIDAMDADVISFEASRSDLKIIDTLNANGFKTAVGPGVYDIHSPRVPTVEEIENALRVMLSKLPKEKLWVNPDCGLKTRGEKETTAALENLVKAAESIRNA